MNSAKNLPSPKWRRCFSSPSPNGFHLRHWRNAKAYVHPCYMHESTVLLKICRLFFSAKYLFILGVILLLLKTKYIMVYNIDLKINLYIGPTYLRIEWFKKSGYMNNNKEKELYNRFRYGSKPWHELALNRKWNTL